MAIYEYLCPKCHREFEFMRPMSEADRPAKCPECGSKASKLVSGFASKTGDSIQPPGEPFRKTTVARAASPRGGAKTAKSASKRRSKPGTRK